MCYNKGRSETIIRKAERQGKAKAKFLEEQRQKHHEGDNPETKFR